MFMIPQIEITRMCSIMHDMGLIFIRFVGRWSNKAIYVRISQLDNTHVSIRSIEELLYHIFDMTNAIIQICKVGCSTTTKVDEHTMSGELAFPESS